MLEYCGLLSSGPFGYEFGRLVGDAASGHTLDAAYFDAVSEISESDCTGLVPKGFNRTPATDFM